MPGQHRQGQFGRDPHQPHAELDHRHRARLGDQTDGTGGQLLPGTVGLAGKCMAFNDRCSKTGQRHGPGQPVAHSEQVERIIKRVLCQFARQPGVGAGQQDQRIRGRQCCQSQPLPFGQMIALRPGIDDQNQFAARHSRRSCRNSLPQPARLRPSRLLAPRGRYATLTPAAAPRSPRCRRDVGGLNCCYAAGRGLETLTGGRRRMPAGLADQAAYGAHRRSGPRVRLFRS